MLQESLKNLPWVTPARKQQGWNRSQPLDTIRPFHFGCSLFTAPQVLKCPLQLWKKKKGICGRTEVFYLCASSWWLRWLRICLQCGRARFDPWVRKIPLERGMATHSRILAWRIPWTEEPGGLWSIGSQRVRHNWASNSYLQLVLITASVEMTHGPCKSRAWTKQKAEILRSPWPGGAG